MNKRELFLVPSALLMLFVLLMLISSGVHATAVVWTDKADYASWETVTVYGSGYNPNTNIDIAITRPDSVVDTGSTMSDAFGGFTYYYVLNGMVGTYTVAATDGVNSATTTFTEKGFPGDQIQFHQYANKDDEWIGSILNKGNSEYYECMSVPQRVIFINITATSGTVHNLTFAHQATKGGIHAYDWLTAWNQGNDPPLTYNPWGDEIKHTPIDFAIICQNLHHAPATAYEIFVDVPDDPFTSQHGSTQDRIDAYELEYGNRQIRICGNQPITWASLTLSHDVPDGGDTGDSHIEYFLEWTSESDEILIEMAGHLAMSGDPATNGIAWGLGLGASQIQGGPYHFYLHDLDDLTLGNQDNQIMGADILMIKGRKGGYKYEDLTGNGPSADDRPLSGWTINLYKWDGGAWVFQTSDVTDLSGYYEFTDLEAGDYKVGETLQSGWVCTYPDPAEYTFTVTSGFEDLDNNFYNFKLVEVTAWKFEDLDGDGDTDVPIAGWEVHLTIDGAIIDTRYTDASGKYTWTSLGQLPAGSYYDISETVPPGWTATSPTSYTFESPPQSGASYSGTFTNFKLGKKGGYNWDDTDGDGFWDLTDAEAAEDGWTIMLYKKVDTVWVWQENATTGVGMWPTGYYEFTGLTAGWYRVVESLPAGWICTCPGDPPEYEFNVTSGFEDLDNNFGNYEWQDLITSKTANVEWVQTFDWDIEKSADRTTLNLFEGEKGTIGYTITVTKSVASDSYRVYGAITIVNPNPVAIVVTANVLDEVLNPLGDVVGSEDFGAQTLASGTNTFDYSIVLLPDDIMTGDYINNATLTVTEPIGGTYVAYSPTFEFNDPTEKVHDSAVVSDSEDLGGLMLVSTTYDGPWATSTSNSWSFTKTVNGDVAGTYILRDTAEVRGSDLLDSDEASVTVEVHALTVTKIAEVEWVQTFAWTTTKTADPTALNLLVGEEDAVNYIITLTRSVASDYYRIYGTITIVNPNPDSSATATITDDLIGISGETCTVTPTSATVLKGGSATVNYECTGFTPTVGKEYTNEATVTLTLTGKTYIGIKKLTFTAPTQLVDDQATIVDVQIVSPGLSVTQDPVMTWPQTISDSTTYNYVKTVSSSTAGTYHIHDTAEFVTDDTGATDSATASVEITFEAPPPPVGGVWVPINKFELLTPWIGMASVITVAAVSVFYVRHKKKQHN